MSLQITLDYLVDLSQNNNKVWFEANRGHYKQARGAFEDLVADLITALGTLEDFGAVTPKECMFRINRDVRFSKDKSPYNAHMSAQIARGGRHGMGRSYYLMIAPKDESILASGLYELEKGPLDNIRQHLVLDAAPLRKIIGAPDFVRYFGSLSGEKLKSAPSGYDRAHPNIDMINYKQLLAVHKLLDSDVVASDLVARSVAVRNALQPFLAYLGGAIKPPQPPSHRS